MEFDILLSSPLVVFENIGIKRRCLVWMGYGSNEGQSLHG
jgi:hypothetical protein